MATHFEQLDTLWSHAFGAHFGVEEEKKLPRPDPVAAPGPGVLDDLSFGIRYNGPSTSASLSVKNGIESSNKPPRDPASSTTPNEVEMSRPPSPEFPEAATVVQSWNNPPINKWRIGCTSLVYFGNGLLDSAPGALIPYIERDYSIGYAVVSLIFVTFALGFILAAFLTATLDQKVGRARSLVGAELVMIAGFVIIVCHPPYPAVVVAYLFAGLGYGINLALNNVFCANLDGSTVIFGMTSGAYGIGGITGPLVATALASNGVQWNLFYALAIAVRVICCAAVYSFKNYERDTHVPLLTNLEMAAMRQARAGAESNSPRRFQMLKDALKNRMTIIGALFIFAYQGAEVSISGWVISFLISYRGGDPGQVGYVTAGFWGGITLGRFTIVHIATRVGEKPLVYVLVGASVIFQLLVWFVPNIIGNAVAVSILGLLLGPVYPCAMTMFMRSTPRKIQTMSMGFLSSAGSSGGAVAPFTTGLIAQAAGTFVLHPICIFLFLFMEMCWFTVPKTSKRME